MIRTVSHSEAQTLLDCAARWDFSYGGFLAGSALRPKVTAYRLREGAAWGRAVAALMAADDRLSEPRGAAELELADALAEDAEEQQEHGVYDPEAHAEMRAHLRGLLDHCMSEWTPLRIDRLEHELDVAIPSRTGRQRSNRYRFNGRVDGVHVDEHGEWIVENKLRGELSSFEQVSLSRQIRWYAWAWRETTGRAPVGVIVEERLNEAPRPAKVNKDGRPSTDKRQMTTPALYRDACRAAGVEPDAETLEAFAARRWQARHRVFLTAAEISEAGRQITSVARHIHLLEAGQLYPVRNPSRQRCGGCAYREICNTPRDTELVDALYERVPAKRDRVKETFAA